MNDVQPLSCLVQKRTEGMQVYRFQCLQDGKPVAPNPNNRYQVSLATQDSLVKTVDMQIEGTKLSFRSEQIFDVPAGLYKLEIWEIVNDKVHAIYPANRSLEFDVITNSRDLPSGTISSLTLDEFEKRLKQLAAQGGSSISLDQATRTITVDGQSLQVPPAVDLAAYLTKDSADQMYARKDQLPDISQYARRRPVSVRAGMEDKTDYYFAFDNGAEIHFPSGTPRGILFDVDGYGNPNTQGIKEEQIMDNVTAWLHGFLGLANLRSAGANLYHNWSGTRVKAPLYNVDLYNWSAVQLTSSPIATQGELDFVKTWYAVGLLTAGQIESLGAIKK